MEKAYSGDVIKIIKPDEEADYEVGQLFTVDLRVSDLGASDDDMVMTIDEEYILDEEYEIIEWNNPIHSENVIKKYLKRTNDELLSEFKWGSQGRSSFTLFMKHIRKLH